MVGVLDILLLLMLNISNKLVEIFEEINIFLGD